MPTNILLSENNFFRSNQIKVYPASFRGSYPQGDGTTKFDPESTLTTEYNITRPVTAGNRTTYIISWDGVNRKLTCVIGGYYFEISGITASALSNKYLCINKRTIDLNNTDTDSQRTTSVLASFRTDSIALDEPDNHNNYFFTGLLISGAPVEGTASEFGLKAFLDNGTINYAEFIPDIRNGSGNKNSQPTSLVFGTLAAATAHRSIAVGDQAKATGEHSFAFGSGAFATADNAIAIGNTARSSGINAVAIGNGTKASGEYAISLGNKTEATGINSYTSGYKTLADGSYSQASGNTTQAHGEASVAEGNSTATYGKYSHAGGNGTQANGDCSVAFGDHTVADQANQFVLGAFNKNEEDSVFEIGNGTAEGSRKNIFKVDKEGNTALKSLTASGNLDVTGTAKFGKDGKEALIVGENQVTINPEAVFNDSVTAKNLTVGNNLTVTGKLSADASGTTVNKRLTIQGKHSLVYDSATGSLAVGTHNSTGAGAAALTSGSDASGANAFAIGAKNNVSGDGSAAFGTGNTISEDYSLASGIGNTVSGTGSAAIGSDNANAKNNAAVFGKGNVANSDGELVIGSFNKRDQSDYPEYFAIGNGTDEGNRNTAFKIAGTGVGKPTEAYIDGKSIATHVMEDTTFKQSLLNLLYPIGSVYVYSGSRDNLNTITDNGNTWCECPIRQTLGGTWTPIEDHFLYAGNQELAKDSKVYNAINTEGGSNAAQVVQHTHTAKGTYEGYPKSITDENQSLKSLSGCFRTGRGEYGRVLHATPDTRPDRNTGIATNGIITIYSGNNDSWTLGGSTKTMQEVQLRPNQWHRPDQIKIDATHCHKMSTDEVIVNVNGVPESQRAVNPKNNLANMPKYLCVYAWKRIA